MNKIKLLLILLIIIMFININYFNKCDNKNKLIKNKSDIIENYFNDIDMGILLITLNESKNKFIFRNNWSSINYENFKEFNIDKKNIDIDNDNTNIILNKDGLYLIEVFGKTKDYRDDDKFNKLSISNGIGIFINNELKNENWNNCDNYGRGSFNLSFSYKLKKSDKIQFKLKYDDNMDDYINNNNIKDKDIDKYHYDYSNGCVYIIIKITYLG